MPAPAIEVNNVWKEYSIGRAQRADENLREMIYRVASSSFRPRDNADETDTERKIWALRDVSLKIEQGEAVGIVGRNGAGKSTLLKILSRITEPTRGQVIVRGRVSSLLQVGTGFHPELTGRENVFLNGSILGMSRREIQRKFDDIVAFAEVEKFIDTPVKHYSSGMHVRLGFAVSAHIEPEILIVDEALAVGDVAFRKKSLEKMRDLSGQGRTVLFVSHALDAIQSLCTRVVVLKQGEINFIGGVEEAAERYMEEVAEVARPEPTKEADTRKAKRAPQLELGVNAKIEKVSAWATRDSTELSTFDPLTFEMEVTVHRPVADVVFGWSLHTIEGGCVFESHSLDSYGPISALAPGRYRVRTEIASLPVRSGLYVIRAGLKDASKTLDYLHEALCIRVEHMKQDQGNWRADLRGVVQIKSHWPRLDVI